MNNLSFPTKIMPRVSIVMPSHNHGEYIREAIDTIREQSFMDWELIIMDYSSNDTTWEVLDTVDDKRVAKVRYKQPGMGRALNEGFRLAQGEYLCWFQTDNLSNPEWLETMVRELDMNQDVDFIYSDFVNIDEYGEILEEVRYGSFDPDKLLSYCLVGPTFLYRHNIYNTVGDYLDSHPRDDHDYWVRVWQHGFSMKNIPEILGSNRLHSNTRMCRMREEYDDSVYDVISSNIHRAQTRGEEVFRVRDRSTVVLEKLRGDYDRLRSRVRYFLCFFMHSMPEIKIAVYGLGPVEKMVLDILDELGATSGVLGKGRYFELPFMDAGSFKIWGGVYVLICGYDRDGSISEKLVAEGIELEKIVNIFLPGREIHNG